MLGGPAGPAGTTARPPAANSSARKFWASVLAVAAGVAALIGADGGSRDIQHDAITATLLGTAFLFALVVIVYTSLADRMQISLQTLTLYFAIYLLLPGFNHATRGSYPFFSMKYSTSVQQDGALMVLVFLLSVIGTYFFFNKHKGALPRFKRSLRDIEPNTYLAVILTIMAIAGMIAYLNAIGIGNAFGKRQEVVLTDIDTQSSGLTIALPRMICVVSINYALLVMRFSVRKTLGLMLLGLNMIPAVFVLFPLGLPRSQLFGLILFISMIYVAYERPGRRLTLSALYLIGALIFMPLVDALGRQGRKLAELDAATLFGAYFKSGDFDGLQSILNVVIYVQGYGVQLGHQFLGVILFFVPRAIWPGKADPTGSIAAEAAGYRFFNVSMPLPGEFYADFGWFGVVLGGAALGWLLWRIDAFIDANWTNGARGRLIAGTMVGYSIVIYRGTLIGVIAPFAVLCVLVAIVTRFGLRPARTGHD